MSFARIIIITRDGVTMPNVETIPPKIPSCLYPMKVETFIAMIPGVDCPIA